ncbi:MAG: DNA-binding protein YbiB [Proteobacteria bacterium]|nr:MAG: DNA-binding protein YbiB [Pseudomonadota bacterium]
MSFSPVIREITGEAGSGAELSEEAASALFAAMLDGGIPDLELGALLAALQIRGPSAAEVIGFQRAAAARLYLLRPPDTRLRPLVIPAYGGARTEHNLLPLLGMLLRRLGVPILFHGSLEGSGRVACVYILRELGVMPSASLAQAQKGLDEDLLAFVPSAVLCPGLAALLALRHRLGVRNVSHIVTKLLDPFDGQGVQLVGASLPRTLEMLAVVLVAGGFSALLLRSTEGEPFADPRRRPRIDWFDQGEHTVLFDEEAGPVKPVAGLPASVEAHATALWVQQALAGEAPIPHPLVNQLACCLYVSGYTDDMNQAKAIAAVETGSLGAVSRRRGGQSRSSRALTR